VDNAGIARILGDIADLLEIKGENAFKIRAYRSAADVVQTAGEPVARLTDAQLRALPGIGKDLSARIRELADTGTCAPYQELLQAFPPTILELLRLQGVGPKTVAQLYHSLGVASVEALAAAAQSGRLRELKGMGAKKESLILKAIEERTRSAGRQLLADAAALAQDFIASIVAAHPSASVVPVGSLRRGVETCGDVDLLCTGVDDTAMGDAVMDTFVANPRVERVLGRGDTKSSVRVRGGFQVDLRVVPSESRGAAMQYFTGSKAHNIELRDRALKRGMTLNEYGLTRLESGEVVASETEEAIYTALGLAWIAPELREHKGEIDAAESGGLPALVTPGDLRGDLHMHTTATDGRDTLEAMAAEARRLGYSYIAITDHSKALAMANGLDERRALEHAARVRALNGRFEDLTLLAGIECDILADGSLDLADDCLAQLDVVVASIHSHFSQEPAQLTDRVLRALECRWVDVLGHPTGRRLLSRQGLPMDMLRVVAAAVERGVALEINGQVDRLDLSDAHVRLARDHGARFVISSDAHSTGAFANVRWSLQVARRGWLTPAHVLNTYSLGQLRPALRRNRAA
jgi:DNA polymerase (family X)